MVRLGPSQLRHLHRKRLPGRQDASAPQTYVPKRNSTAILVRP